MITGHLPEPNTGRRPGIPRPPEDPWPGPVVASSPGPGGVQGTQGGPEGIGPPWKEAAGGRGAAVGAVAGAGRARQPDPLPGLAARPARAGVRVLRRAVALVGGRPGRVLDLDLGVLRGRRAGAEPRPRPGGGARARRAAPPWPSGGGPGPAGSRGWP